MEVSPEKRAGSSWRAVEREREVWTTWGVSESVVGRGGEDEKLKKKIKDMEMTSDQVGGERREGWEAGKHELGEIGI